MESKMYVACIQMGEDLYSLNARWDDAPEADVKELFERSIAPGVPTGCYEVTVFRDVTLFRVNWKPGTDKPSNA